jgi:phosphohistidine phosphatase
MKTLLLVRHAKASPVGSTLADRDRPLNERGSQDARAMGKRLARRDLMPDRLVSSPALRALSTARLFAGELGAGHEAIVTDDRLYASSANRLLEVIRSLDDKADCVMLFGHNPEFAELASRLLRRDVEMRTCAVAEFSFDAVEWSAIDAIEPAAFVLENPKN